VPLDQNVFFCEGGVLFTLVQQLLSLSEARSAPSSVSGFLGGTVGARSVSGAIGTNLGLVCNAGNYFVEEATLVLEQSRSVYGRSGTASSCYNGMQLGRRLFHSHQDRRQSSVGRSSVKLVSDSV
jgi:hypothetical protein